MLVQPPKSSAPPLILPRPRCRVRMKANWGDAWQTVVYLQPLTAIDCASPSMPKATFRFRGGKIKWEDQSVFSATSPTQLGAFIGNFVMIEGIPPAAAGVEGAAPFPVWVGRLAEMSADLHGVKNNAIALGAHADYIITAYGLQHDLDREGVRGAWISNVADNTVPPQQISVPLTFNEKFVRGFREIGNRSSIRFPVNGKQTFVFSHDFDGSGNSFPWSVPDIINYLLAAYAPAGIPFVLGGQVDALANIVFPRVAVHHQSVLQLIDSLIDRRRGLGWCLRTTGTGKVEIHVFTVFEKPVTAEGITVPANDQQVTIDVSANPAIVRELKLDQDGLNDYGTIIAAGEPIVSCFTVSFADGTLTEGWTAAKKAEYDAPGVAAAPGPNASDRERSSPRLAHVYSTFKIPASWKWKAGGGENDVGLQPALPSLDVNGRAAAAAPVNTRTWGQTLLRSLPLLKDQADRTNPDGLEPEYLEPMVFVMDPRAQRYIFAHDPGGPPGENAGAHVRMLDHDFGFEVKFHPSHVLGLNHFQTPAQGGDAQPSQHTPKYDYKTLIATVAARSDQRLQVVVTIPNRDPARVLQIDVEDAEYWTIAPNTLRDIKHGKFVKQGTTAPPFGFGPSVLRDDTARLRQIAALAQAWYQTDRSTLSLTVSALWTQYPVGCLVHEIDDGPQKYAYAYVDLAVTEIVWNFEDMTTSIHTRYSELDFRDSGGRAAMPTIR